MVLADLTKLAWLANTTFAVQTVYIKMVLADLTKLVWLADTTFMV